LLTFIFIQRCLFFQKKICGVHEDCIRYLVLLDHIFEIVLNLEYVFFEHRMDNIQVDELKRDLYY
jgi:hypothetical protein